MEPKYPNITVQLSGEDGNAGAIMGRVTRAMSRNDVPTEDIEASAASACPATTTTCCRRA